MIEDKKSPCCGAEWEEVMQSLPVSCCPRCGQSIGAATIDRLREEIERLRAELAAAKEYRDMADGCLNMIREWCEAHGEDMSATPAMMYPEACQTVLAKIVNAETKELLKRVKLADAEVERLRRLCGEAVKQFKENWQSDYFYCPSDEVYDEIKAAAEGKA